MNVATIIGRMVKDPELRKTPSNVDVTSFTVAVSRGKDQDADFIDCVAWRGGASLICRYVKKGDPIGLSGELRTRTYTDKDGNKRKAVEIQVDKIHLLGSKDKNAAEGFETVDDDCDLPWE